MTINKVMPTSIASIEQQIAQVNKALAKARSDQYAIAEKSLLSAQKAAAAARAKVSELLSKAGVTAAAQQRLALTKAALADKELNLAKAEAVLAALKSEQDAAQLFAKNVQRIMAGEKLGKKIKFTKKEKSVLKAEKKAAKKIAKADKKAKKQKHVMPLQLNDIPVAATPTETLITQNTLKAPLVGVTTENSTADSTIEMPLSIESATEDQSTSIETILKP